MRSRQSVRMLVVGATWPLETFLDRLFRDLAAQGVEVTLATSVKPEAGWLSHPLLRWVHLPDWPGGAVGGTAGIRSWHRLLPFTGRRWDLIYFPWNVAAITYHPLLELGIPAVISCRGSQVNVAPHVPNGQSIHSVLEDTFRRAAAVHCVSEAIREEAMAYGLDPAKTWIIRPAVDPAYFCPPAAGRKPGHRFRMVSTGTLMWAQGYEYALLAVQRLVAQGRPVHYQIIGDGPDRQGMRYTIDDLELQNHVELCGCLPPDRLRDRLQEADVFLLSSVSEGISNAVLEAMACGLPIVTTDCGGMAEAVTDGTDGFVVPVRDPHAMAAALERLARNRSLAEQMGHAGRDRMLTDFTLPRQAHQFLGLIRSVTEQQA